MGSHHNAFSPFAQNVARVIYHVSTSVRLKKIPAPWKNSGAFESRMFVLKKIVTCHGVEELLCLAAMGFQSLSSHLKCVNLQYFIPIVNDKATMLKNKKATSS